MSFSPRPRMTKDALGVPVVAPTQAYSPRDNEFGFPTIPAQAPTRADQINKFAGKFGYEGPKLGTVPSGAGDVQARERVLSQPPRYFSDPGDARRAQGLTPTRRESALEDQSIAIQAAIFGQQNAANEQRLAQEQENYAQREAERRREALLDAYGTDDPKMIEKIYESRVLEEQNQEYLRQIAALNESERAQLQAAPTEAVDRIRAHYQHQRNTMAALLAARFGHPIGFPPAERPPAAAIAFDPNNPDSFTRATPTPTPIGQ